MDETSHLPRFNMPLELGIFLGAKRFGVNGQQSKKCIVLDKEPYRYQKFISDISGQDIFVHNNKPEEVVRVVRDWLDTATDRETIPGGSIIWKHYQEFLEDKPQVAYECHYGLEDLENYNNYTNVVAEWLRRQPK